MRTVKPPIQGEMFSRNDTAAIYAFVASLDPTIQHDVVELLQQHLAIPPETESWQTRRTRQAIRSLREAADLLGAPPSIGEYERLRKSNPHFDWATPRSIKRWLGVSDWESALARAGLGESHEPDITTYEVGAMYTTDEVKAALSECAEELQHVPTQGEYMFWRQRPDIRTRPGRRPSYRAIRRLFGAFYPAVQAAGLIERYPRLPYLYPTTATKPVLTDADMIADLRFAAEKLGRSPKTHEYSQIRSQLRDEAKADGRTFFMTCQMTISKRLGGWDPALKAAGLEPINGRRLGGTPKYLARRMTRSQWTRRQMLDALRGARAVYGDPLSSSKYEAWRLSEQLRDPARIYDLPSPLTIARHFGGWPNAAAASATAKGDEDV
jgi:Homing endonuclease associated repeat